MMFGEGRFAPYIGEMTSVIKMRLDDSMSDPLKQVTELQRLTKERDASCAKLLALRLEGALVTPEPWTARMVREIIRLYQTNLGPQLCKAVGKMYQLRAESALGFKARLNQLGFGGGDDAVQLFPALQRRQAPPRRCRRWQQTAHPRRTVAKRLKLKCLT